MSGRELTTEEQELLTPLLVARKEEVQWAGWYTEPTGKKKTEMRICVLGKCRVLYFTLGKKEAKLVRDSHLLDLQEITSKELSNVQIVFKGFTVDMLDFPVDELITSLRQNFENYFFNIPKQRRFKITVEPESRLRPVEGPTQASLQKSCGGFSGTYQALCDFYHINVRNDIAWDMDNLLPANHVKEFDMKEFEQPLTPGDFKVLVEALHFNTYFTGFISHDYKLDKEAMRLIAEMLQINETLERLHLVNGDGISAGFEQIGTAIAKNKKLPITSIDWSYNSVQDKGVASLGGAIGSLPHGLAVLNLDHGDATKKGMSVLCASFKQNIHFPKTLVTLNLAYNRLDADGSQILAGFLSTPNVLRDLNIAYTNSNLDHIFPSITRGCPELVSLNVSGNKIQPQGAAELKKYLQSCSKLRDISLADTNIAVNVVRDVLKGIISNKYFTDVSLNLSSNKLGLLGANMVAGIADELCSIEKLDLSNNEFGDEGLGILTEGLTRVSCLKEVNISDNFNKGKTKQRSSTLDNLVDLCSSENLESLILSASPGYGIGVDLLPFIYSLATNDTLIRLDISGHGIGDKGGIALGKALQTNRTLQALFWDNNNTGLAGLVGFKIGLERNTVLINMPLPILDISAALKIQSNDQAKIQSTVNTISEAISRNQNPKSKFSLEGFSQHISLSGAGEREELNKLRFRIKAAGYEPSAEEKLALKDAEDNDTHISSLHKIQEEMQQALEDEVASRLGKFASELVPFLLETHVQLVDRLVSKIDNEYRCIDKDATSKLRTDLEGIAKESIDKDKISKILALSAAQQITSQITKSFVRTVETASDNVFDQLLDRLEDIYFSASQSSEKEETASENSAPSPSSGRDDGLRKPQPPVPMKAKTAPPLVMGGPKPVPPPKSRKPFGGPQLPGEGQPLQLPGLGQSPNRMAPTRAPPIIPPRAGRGVPSGPMASPRVSPPSGNTQNEDHKLKNLTKDRPMGAAGRRRPQRKPQRRPMMEGAD